MIRSNHTHFSCDVDLGLRSGSLGFMNIITRLSSLTLPHFWQIKPVINAEGLRSSLPQLLQVWGIYMGGIWLGHVDSLSPFLLNRFCILYIGLCKNLPERGFFGCRHSARSAVAIVL